MRFFSFKILLICIIANLMPHVHVVCQDRTTSHFFSDSLQQAINTNVKRLMKTGNIPGLSLVIVQGNNHSIQNFGHADVENEKPVTSQTLFQLASCSKAFTALAVVMLANEGRLKLDQSVSEYLPWFYLQFKGDSTGVTIRQLLHHTSGIPWNTISLIPQTNDEDALEQTVRRVVGTGLFVLPGKQYQYATINYDILALVIERVTGRKFEEYMDRYVFRRLKLANTTVGIPVSSSLMSNGYKIGFFRALEYESPVFRGNNAAGYIISNAEDMARWIKCQMLDYGDSIYNLIRQTHERDESVPLHGMASYCLGWNISLSGNGEIFHEGLNPNFTSYIAFRPGEGAKTGVVVLANSNSSMTTIIGEQVMKMLNHEEIVDQLRPDDRNDKAYSIVVIIVAVYLLALLCFLTLVGIDIVKKKRIFEKSSLSNFFGFCMSVAAVVPFLVSIYLLPRAMVGFSWEATIVWSPISFLLLIESVLIAIAATFLIYALTLFFPEKNKFKKIAPRILLMSILSGTANMMVVILITSSLSSGISWKYLVFYYSLVLALYIFGRRFVQVNLIKFNRSMVFELRMKLINKIFSTSYQKFETISRGRIYTALNDDINTIGESANLFVMLITSVFTALGAFIYLASMAIWATVITICLASMVSAIYYFVSKSTRKYFEDARNTKNVYMELINGMIDGFKEISLKRSKKIEYKSDVSQVANDFRHKISTANIKIVNAAIVSESLLIVLLGAVVFVIPVVFKEIEIYTVMSFVIVLLYLMKPVNEILSSISVVMQLRIAWNRVHQFLEEIPATIDLEKSAPPVMSKVYSLQARSIRYHYKTEHESFEVGPIDLEVNCGEILFVVGGNGSGKTTLAKLLTGLYGPDSGEILINGDVIDSSKLSEHYSAVFSPAHLFEKLYSVDTAALDEKVNRYLQLLNLNDKVQITDNKYSTINLSNGQRKRLALLQCYMEDSPIYLFDEWAADQDPEYRNFFYRTLLPEMKAAGKIVIAITHDDHYFDVADKVLKLKHGKIDYYTHEYAVSRNN